MKRLALALLVLASTGALAAPAGFESDLFHPSDTAGGYFALDGALPVRHLGFTAGLYGTWAHRPLVFRDASGAIRGELIGQQLAMDLVGSFGLWDRLELGLDLPFVPYQDTTGGVTAHGLGDLRLDLKVRVITFRLPGTNRLALSVIAGLRLPTGDQQAFLGQGGVSGYPRLVVEWRHARAGAAINFGAVLRSTVGFGDLSIGHQLAYGAGAWLGLLPVRGWLEALLELDGLVGVDLLPGTALMASQAPAELFAGLRWRTDFGLSVELAGGAGLSRGYGTPDGRLLFGARYEMPRSRPRRVTPPPVIAPDSDGDGVPDPQDHCPQKAGLTAHAGCPDEDSDGDGVVDRLDGCPMTPGLPMNLGCPPPDLDKDGVADEKDRCPEIAGSAANDGCPDIDSDGDGLVDRLDKCPLDPEVYNGNADEDGCPDAGAVLAELQADKIVARVPIGFTGLMVDKRSVKTLSVVARLLALHPEILRLRIEGHTDNKGSAIDNLDLSAARAVAVRRVLVDQFGVDAKRLQAQGFGPDRPLYDNRDPAGRARNNRIELNVIERAAPVVEE